MSKTDGHSENYILARKTDQSQLSKDDELWEVIQRKKGDERRDQRWGGSLLYTCGGWKCVFVVLTLTLRPDEWAQDSYVKSMGSCVKSCGLKHKRTTWFSRSWKRLWHTTIDREGDLKLEMQAAVRTLGFILLAVRSCWGLLSGGRMWSHLYFANSHYCLYNDLEEWSKSRKQEGWLGDLCRSSGEEEDSFEILFLFWKWKLLDMLMSRGEGGGRKGEAKDGY